MNSCLLCLERNKDILDTIEINSTPWRKFNITTVLEKHFWTLNTIQPDCWICLECWQKVEDFHNFYEHIENAHLALEQIKTEEKTNENNEQMELLDATEEPETATKGFVIDKMETEYDSDYYNDMEDFDDTHDNLLESNELNDKRLENKQSAEDSSNNTESANDDNDKDIKIKRRIYNTYTKSNEINDKRSIEELDEFIAKEFGQIKCDLCSIPLKDFTETNNHFQKHHKQQAYVKCCEKKFRYRNLLVDHLNCHLNPEYFKCKECGKSFSCRGNLSVHMKRLHRPENVEYEHKCEDCGKTFPMNCILRVHKLSHLGTVGEFPCKECGKIYRAEHLLKRHYDVTHLKKCARICAVCGKSFDTGNMLRAHMARHEPQKPVNCDVCGILLSNERNYLFHRRIQHPEGDKQEHHCHICGKIYPIRRSLTRHINVVHKKGYDHKCTMCEKAFKYPAALREHMTTHTGETLYTCAYCPKTYNSRANLIKHRQNIHAKEWAIDKHKRYYGTNSVPKENVT